MALHLSWVFLFGLLGNIISCLVCLAPLPTFYRVFKKKTSEGFQSIPYVIALFSAMLWLFYAIFAQDATLLITINSFTFLMEIGYITVYLLYATRKDRIFTAKLILLLNVLGFGIICIVSLVLTHGDARVKLLGWICMIFALCVFVAPLGIVRKVIKTKSVEFMPFNLSFFLTLSAVMWFFFGYLKKDPFVAVPNILGFLFGIIQMVLYAIYRDSDKKVVEAEKPKVHELSEVHVVDVAKLSEATCSDLSTVEVPENIEHGSETGDDQEQILKEIKTETITEQDIDAVISIQQGLND